MLNAPEQSAVFNAFFPFTLLCVFFYYSNSVIAVAIIKLYSYFTFNTEEYQNEIESKGVRERTIIQSIMSISIGEQKRSQYFVYLRDNFSV